MTEPSDLSAVAARRLIGAKKLSPVELLESCLKRIEQVDGAVNAITAIDVAAARKAAKRAEAEVMAGASLDVLHGLPVAVKDLEATGGLRTTYGSVLFKDHVPETDQLERRQRPRCRRRHFVQDQHAGIRRWRQLTQ